MHWFLEAGFRAALPKRVCKCQPRQVDAEGWRGMWEAKRGSFWAGVDRPVSRLGGTSLCNLGQILTPVPGLVGLAQAAWLASVFRHRIRRTIHTEVYCH